MKWKTRKNLLITACLALLILQIIQFSYSPTSNDTVYLTSDVYLQPTTMHTYSLESALYIRNMTLDSGNLTLSRGSNAYEIRCYTIDDVDIQINSWFHGTHYLTEFRPISETLNLLTFQVNTQLRGEPAQITGVSSWSYDEASLTLSLTCQNRSLVSFFYLSDAEAQFTWYMNRMDVWMGISGIALMIVSPFLVVFCIKNEDYEFASLIALVGFALGFCMMIGWLWG